MTNKVGFLMNEAE